MIELEKCHCISGIAEIANQYDAFLIDQWGVIHDGNQLYPQAADVLQRLRRSGKQILIVTNSSKTNEVNRLRLLSRFGLTTEYYTSVVSSAQLLRDLMSEKSIPPWRDLGKRVLVLDNGQNAALIDGTELELVSDVNLADVIMFLDIPEGETHVHNQHWIDVGVERGIPLVCPSSDSLTVTVNGVFGGMGSVVREYLRKGGKVINVGKPERVVYEYCATFIGGIEPCRVLAIGDQIGSDIVGARRFGFDAALVATGAARVTFPAAQSLADLARHALAYVPPMLGPNFVLPALQWGADVRQ